MSVESTPVARAINVDSYCKIKSKDNKEFKVSLKAIQQSETLNSLLENMGYTAENADQQPAIPVDNIDGATLELVFKWCEHYKGEPMPKEEDSNPKNVVIEEFDSNLLNIGDMELFDLICACDYLSIRKLLNIACRKVSDMAKGKTAEELRVIFGIPSNEEDEIAAAPAQ
ncbi:hypothetical protein CAEBREN_09622 [Caenorhabditis brenneri]|uniref:Skp1-related protein n=1 Tax=Caenorhabditis brenneri TaxID=135651 RepID=G0MZK2_CAEBE|nr:hypothetical protein CAEBREN_09622 [Caenorhabditis brenneri]